MYIIRTFNDTRPLYTIFNPDSYLDPDYGFIRIGILYKIVTTQNVWTGRTITTRTTGGTTTLDFNSADFNLSRTVKGTAQVSMAIGITSSANGKLSAEMFHVTSGDTATSISSEITSESTTTNGGTMIFLELPLTQTHLKKGEHLRMTIKLIQTGDGGTTEVGHSPNNIDGSAGGLYPSTNSEVTTVMRLLMPLRINILNGRI